MVIKLTAMSCTPGSFFTAFSTWATQALQVIPVTSNFCFITVHPIFLKIKSIEFRYPTLEGYLPKVIINKLQRESSKK